MGQKIIRLIIMGLAALLLVSIFIGFQIYISKKPIEQERDALKNENQNLTKKVQEITQERKQLQDKINALTADLDKAAQEKQNFQSQYDAMVKEKDGLVDKVRETVKALQKENDQLRADLNKLTREKQQLGQSAAADLTPLKQENAKLQQELANLNNLKSKLENELTQLKGEKSDLQRKLDEIDSFLEQRLSKLRYLSLKEHLDSIRSGTKPETSAPQPEQETVELPPIVVKAQTKGETEPFSKAQKKRGPVFKRTGTILEVNRENRFVIIDLGEELDVKVGDTFNVYRQDSPIGTIEVIQVRPTIAACDIKGEAKPLEAGDSVRQK